jgi:hypothetical protein
MLIDETHYANHRKEDGASVTTMADISDQTFVRLYKLSPQAVAAMPFMAKKMLYRWGSPLNLHPPAVW